jgi:putative nucleotidyltransferase with HDIG domain
LWLVVRSTRYLIAVELLLLVGAVALAVLRQSTTDLEFQVPLFLTLLAFSVIGDLRAVETTRGVKISGSFLALVLAMVLLGGPAAAAIGVITMTVGWLRWRDKPLFFLNNIVTYACFPLLGGIVFHSLADAFNLTPDDGFFYLLVLVVFMFALALNFSMIAVHTTLVEGTPYMEQVRKHVVPVISSEVAAATLAVGIAFLYHQVGLVAIVLFAVVLFTFQHLLGQLLVSEERAEELERRARQLASLQVGVLSALLHTLDLRDRMTARHSAAVARYAKEIARAAGYSDEEQDLVHTAGLLHDIGKFVFPDSVLKGNRKLTDEDWNIIRKHPYQGSKIVSQVEGYGPVGEIILAHHERIDGKGYPRRLEGEEIPAFSRMISVADTYDVMTARDSYREPVSSFEAITELRRVSGTQLDGYFVEVFIEVLAGKDVRYRHGEDADFDAELGLEKRVQDYAELGSSAIFEKATAPERAQEHASEEPADADQQPTVAGHPTP